MDLPPEIVKKYILIPGGAFQQLRQYPTDKEEKLRYFFILNQHPQEDDTLVIVTATTKIVNVVKHFYQPGLVFVDHDEYDAIPKPSVLNCNQAEPRQKAQFLSEIDQGHVKYIPSLPPEVLQRCKMAIAATPTVVEKLKRLVLGEE